MGLRFIAAITLIITAFFLLTATKADAQTDGNTGSLSEQMLDGQLDNSEVDEIGKAVDQALEDSGAGSIDISADKLLESAIKGKPMDNLKGLAPTLLSLLGKEIKGNVALMMELIAIMLLAAMLKALQPGERGLSSDSVRLAVNGVIAVIAAASFGSIVKVAQGAIESMQVLASLAMPALFALLASSGQVVSASVLQPLMLAGVNFACHIFKTVLLPLVIMAGILFLVDGVSERFKLRTLAKLLKTCTVWITSAITLIFTLAVTLQRLAGSSVDAAAVKTAKFAIGTLVPVAGKNMSDAAETLLACANAVKNAAGIVTVLALALISLIPFIKILVIMLAYKLAAAFGAPLCEGSICDSLDDAAGCMMVMLGIMGASLFVLVLMTGSLLSVGGFPI